MLFEEPVVQELAKKYNKTEGQIILRWAVQQGLAIIPKTSKKERLKENSDLFSWNLEEKDMNSIDKLNKNKRYNNPTIQCEKAWNFLTPFPIYE
jgi:D-xylose reductase